ncbi:MAG: hypothetical protein U7127_29865 [Phormidium sp.]
MKTFPDIFHQSPEIEANGIHGYTNKTCRRRFQEKFILSPRRRTSFL